MSPCNGMTYPPSLTLLSCSSSVELADFCALVVPRIWSGSSYNRQPVLDAKRFNTFRAFCHKLLKATQISCACVVLSLYYIQRLRSAYPSIRASIGSEVRLFTTALILANKFLDDNTFTAKVNAYHRSTYTYAHMMEIIVDLVRSIQHPCTRTEHHGNGISIST